MRATDTTMCRVHPTLHFRQFLFTGLDNATAALYFGAYNSIGGDGGGSTTMAWWHPTSGSTLLNVPVGNGYTAGTERTVPAFGVWKAAPASFTWNPITEFSKEDVNPFIVHDGGKWGYGKTPTLGGTFTAFTTAGNWATDIEDWYTSTPDPLDDGTITKNVSASAYYESAPPGGFHWDPAETCLSSPEVGATCKSVARWTALFPGTVSVSVAFKGRNYTSGSNADVHVLLNGATDPTEFSSTVVGLSGTAAESYSDAFGANPTATYSDSLTVVAGDTIDLVVGSGEGGGGDLVAISVTLTMNTGSISGTVTSSGTPVPGVVIKHGSNWMAVTDSSGDYSIPVTGVGTYNLTASADGHTDKTESVTVASSQNTDRDFAG